MKTKEELNALKEEVEALNNKLNELTEEELEQVCGGFMPIILRNADIPAKNGGFNQPSELAEILINGLMSDKSHPGFVTAELGYANSEPGGGKTLCG